MDRYCPSGDKMTNEAPISPLSAPTHGNELWKEIDALFERHGLDHPPYRLRDELVNHLAWARYAASRRPVEPPAPEVRQTGTEKRTVWVIGKLPEGVYPTHFRPNDTVYGHALTKSETPSDV